MPNHDIITVVNNRAELMAAIQVLGLELRPVNIRTDSRYVFDGVTRHRFKWRQSGWRGRRRLITNSDLWMQLDAILANRPEKDVLFT